MFDVGALIFKIQVAGAQVFQRDMAQSDQAISKVEGSARKAKKSVDEQGKSTEELGKKSNDAAPKQRKQAEATEAQVQAAKTLSLALIAGGAAITAVVGLSVAKYTEFGAAMSNVRAATMATAEEQRDLADAALEAGADTAYSATEAAAAQEELAKAGMSVSQVINGGLTGALSLAAAGQLAVARSAEIMATTLTQFKLPAEDAARVSDVLAAGAGKAQGSVEDLSLALNYVGPLAEQAGWSLEETGGALSYFASQGILGEKAGTSLRGVLAALQSPSAIAKRTMDEYGLSIYDANGNMLSASEIAGNLAKAFGGLTKQERDAAMGRIFGNESLLAATLLYDGGSKAIKEWTAAVDDSGYAADQAAMRQDNLAGDVEKLGGAFDTALIKTGSGANDVLREMVQTVTAMVDIYGEAPAEVQQTALVLGVLTGAVLLASGSALGLTARFSELRAELAKNNISMGKTAAIGGAVGLAFAGVVTVVGILAQKQAEARAKAEGYADAMENSAAAVRELAQENLEAERTLAWLNFGSAYDNADKLGISLNLVTDAVTGNVSAMEELDAVLSTATEGGQAAQEMADELGISYLDLSQSAGTLREQVDEERAAQERAKTLREQATRATDEQTASTQTASEAYVAAADSASDLNSQIQQLIDAVNEANGVGQDAVTANAAWQDALAGIAEQAESTGTSLDQNTEAGSANAAMLAGAAADAITAAEAQFLLDQQTMSGKEAADKYAETLAAQRQAFVDSAVAAGYNADEVWALADQVFKLPSEKEIDILADTVPAREAINGFIRDQSGRTITLRVMTDNSQGYSFDGGNTFAQADGGKVEFFASGGRHEHHVAQFARAGDWRVWAEPETGGEWYLPNSPAKRARSLGIAQQMLSEWGYAMVPVGAQRFADGSPTTGAGFDLSGLEITGTLDLGDGIRGIVRGEIVAHDRAQARTAHGRTQKI